MAYSFNPSASLLENQTAIFHEIQAALLEDRPFAPLPSDDVLWHRAGLCLSRLMDEYAASLPDAREDYLRTFE